MSKAIFLPCDDGSDPQCYGEVEAEEVTNSYDKLTLEQQQEVEDIAEDTKRGEKLVAEFGEISVIFAPQSCAACGSDVTRNQDGNIIN